MTRPLLQRKEAGIYCEAGDFYIDPQQPVDRALVTHAHMDHARPGHNTTICSAHTARLLKIRLGESVTTETWGTGEAHQLGDVRVSLHPAGHILGSCQVRIETEAGEVWVYSGDYTPYPDPSCEPFEPLPCDTFVSECTYGLPLYSWPEPGEEYAALRAWWEENQKNGYTTVVFTYALGKAQRLLHALTSCRSPIGAHGSIRSMLPAYEEAGVSFPEVMPVNKDTQSTLRGNGLVVAPASTDESTWLKKVSPYATASASGWMRIRGQRRRMGVDRGFVLSDHADWPGILNTIRQTGAKRVGLVHGNGETLARWLQEMQDPPVEECFLL